MKLLQRRGTIAVEPDRDQRLTWRIAAFLLDYPNEQTLAMLPDLRATAESMAPLLGGPLLKFIDYALTQNQISLGQEYVATFDLKRRSCLHLTYYACGDTRKRGMALLRFKHAYKAAGTPFGEDSGELPDHISVVLEFAATVAPVVGARLLGEHLPPLELLRISLEENESPYQHVIAAILATLPPITNADRRRIEQLAAEGPPEEEVGLEPFAMDPTLYNEEGGRR
ncbi:nitrate reductase molybdenum cofactor assembly chaperone [Smaragdicoccus niigatensis]|uniref:nitrate reductase molybdenum cofactor assembly chaperone n=1 Tax=Smaragdicoccus niigatensis TaxID=359359 RepID=UPI00037FFD3A|nr:nitrate reductase molybdenum cofactor assembly chaperone [Smaragdicoccus niigatensis]